MAYKVSIDVLTSIKDHLKQTKQFLDGLDTSAEYMEADEKEDHKKLLETNLKLILLLEEEFYID